MLFNSIEFFVFFPVVCILFFAIPHRWKNIFLLSASYFFYMCWNPAYLSLLLFSTLITYASGLLLETTLEERKRKAVVLLSFTTNIGLLIYFKYFDFLASSLNELFLAIHLNTQLSLRHALLPVGISFYIFQALGYTMDIYRKTIPAERNFVSYALFVSFFPQLVAGPIERSSSFLPQIRLKKQFDFYRVRDGILLMLYGLFQKMVVADHLAKVVDEVYGNYEIYSGFVVVIAIFSFSIQIYCDFAGYSNTAIGAAKVLGFCLTPNFRQPYFASGIRDFWKRWHISLTSWFRDYLYIPLGGNKKGKVRASLNRLVVFLVSGLWHGAAGHFLFWGGIHGVAEELEICSTKLSASAQKSKFSKTARWLSRGGTFICVSAFWVFFRAENTRSALGMYGHIFRNFMLHWDGCFLPGLAREFWEPVLLAVAAVFLIDFIHERNISIRLWLDRRTKAFRWLCYIALFVSILLFGAYGGENNRNAFIYFQF